MNGQSKITHAFSSFVFNAFFFSFVLITNGVEGKFGGYLFKVEKMKR